MRIRNKKGMTLVELVVVLVLVALVSAVTMTFSVLVQKRAQLNSARNDIMKDISSVEVLTKSWIVHYDNYDYTLFLEDVGSTYDYAPQIDVKDSASAVFKPVLVARSATDESKKFRLSFSDGTLSGDWIVVDENGEDETVDSTRYFSEYITDIQFALFSSNDSYANKRRLVRMDVTYTDPESGEPDRISLMFTTHAQATLTDH